MSHRITLFKDVVHRDGKTTSTTQQQTLRGSHVRYITSASSASQPSAVGDVIAVCQNGEVVGLSGENLAVQWTAPSQSAVQDVSPAAIENFDVDYVASGTLAELSEGIFKGRPEVFTALPKGVDADPTLLILVSRSTIQGQESRHLVVLAVVSASKSTTGELQRLTPLDVVPITSDSTVKGTPSYQVDAQSGMLLQLLKGSLSVYDLTGAVPKLKSTIPMNDADSFTRLSRPFVLSSSLTSISLYNYQYRSSHASTPLDLSDLPAESRDAQSCQLISHLRSQDLVVALIDNLLVSIQVSPPKSAGKRRKAGLLIDSIGRGTPLELTKKPKIEITAPEFSKKLPGTVTAMYIAKHAAKLKKADELLSNKQIAEWEEKLRAEFRVNLASGKFKDGTDTVEWDWLLDSSRYPQVDRHWVIYAIRQAFCVENIDGEDPHLKLREVAVGDDTTYPANVTTYLTVAGHLTLSNLESAFGSKSLAADLIQTLTDVDPSMTLLYNYLRATNLSETEVLLAIRAIMLSMDLLPKPQLLENGDADDMDLDDLEREIARTETYLGDENSIRSRSLTLSFTKLWRLPSRLTVAALRNVLSTAEILSLIHLLRIELVQGAWTSLYMDHDSETFDPPPDGVIVLISDLLGRCVDAVGAGGWLLNDALAGDDILTALKLEVSAALKGIEEAVTLNGFVSEATRYCSSNGAARGGAMLPLGLKGKGVVGREKVVSGGEVVVTSLRERGHLISQKVEAYSVERLFV